MGIAAKIISIATTITIAISCTTDKSCDEPTIYAMSIGIDKYKNQTTLINAEADARGFAEAIKKHTKKTISLYGEDATHDEIISKMKALFSEARTKDAIALYLSVHGNREGIYCYDTDTLDKRLLTYKEIQTIFKKSNATKKMIFMDACHSGSIIEAIEDKTHRDEKEAEIMLFLSSRAKENSQEKANEINSLFTKHLLNGLSGRSDINRDKIITAKELYIYVHTKMAAETKEEQQHPVMWGRFDENMTIIDWNNK